MLLVLIKSTGKRNASGNNALYSAVPISIALPPCTTPWGALLGTQNEVRDMWRNCESLMWCWYYNTF